MSTALITGATAGLGAEFARTLAAEGSDLVLVARDEARLKVKKSELEGRYGVHVEVLSADLSTVDGCDRVANRIESLVSPIDTVVNNAGLATYRTFGKAKLTDEERQLDLNVRAVLRLTHAAVQAMVARRSGLIINVSSVAGFTPRGGNVTYSASKAWVTMFSEALAVQVAGKGVQVTALCPGFTRTEFHQRASADMSHVPRWLWLDAADVVRDGLRDARRGKAISVPSVRYKVITTVARHLPRPLLYRVMRRRGL